jgi:rare lipoprotein A
MPFHAPKQRRVELFLEEMFFRSPVHAGSALIVACAAMAASCSHPRARAVTPAPPAQVGTTETGVASWYGIPYHGRQTASGEIYNMYQLTAAHRNLPFQTWVEVENLTNGKRVDVRINDRGPFVHNRIIDLSQTAADKIDMLRPGTARVRLTVIARPTRPVELSPEASPVAAPSVTPDRSVTPPSIPEDSPAPSSPPVTTLPPSPVLPPLPASPPSSALPAPELSPAIIPMPRYAVQAGAFTDREHAEILRATMSASFAEARTLIDNTRTPPLWRVLVGRQMTREQATNLAARVRSEAGAGFIVPEPE